MNIPTINVVIENDRGDIYEGKTPRLETEINDHIQIQLHTRAPTCATGTVIMIEKLVED